MIFSSFIKTLRKSLFGLGSKDYSYRNTDTTILNRDLAIEDIEFLVAQRLEKQVQELQLQVKNFKIFIDLDTAHLTGTALNQSTKEKIILIVGNTPGISLIDDQLIVDQNEPKAEFYTVKTGDTLNLIAKNMYGNADKFSVILNANKPMLDDPNNIYPGQVLRVPEFH